MFGYNKLIIQCAYNLQYRKGMVCDVMIKKYAGKTE